MPFYLQNLEKINPVHWFFNTGGLSKRLLVGLVGFSACLIPAPKHVLIDRDKEGNENPLTHQQQTSEAMLSNFRL